MASSSSFHAWLTYSLINQWLYSPLLCPGLFFTFKIFLTQTVGLLGRVISPSQGRYQHRGQHKHRTNAHTDTHALYGIRTHVPSARESEDSSCPRPRGHCDRHAWLFSFYDERSILIFLRNVGQFLPDYMPSHPRRQYYSLILNGDQPPGKRRKYILFIRNKYIWLYWNGNTNESTILRFWTLSIVLFLSKHRPLYISKLNILETGFCLIVR
jgi:hypothetical protein